MSSSIAIPKRKGKGPAHNPRNSSSSSSFVASTPETPNHYNYNFSTPSPTRFSYAGGGSSYGSTPSSTSSSGSPTQNNASNMRRRESLMSETFARQEHIVVNVGEEDEGGLRLITCVKASQGFDWNQEMFLPSYIDYHFDDLERRQDPVQDIIITDEEVRNMFPQ
ncbi:uncharacterized protein ALTATR162_LOCUS10990 [Alternaria atra]|uniref:Uncharacterized protein n=1 Tax=Alternaria atra TaxID=119953 RepID=A0A8J2N583_9PLEO|nr:uncharacterized protein ALTATR162_LOCUS10990 [Alternaria atra]CAG5184600.1 unnamed protein product [Alternaria atra]